MPKRRASAASAAPVDDVVDDDEITQGSKPVKFVRYRLPDALLLSQTWDDLPPKDVKALAALGPDKRAELQTATLRYCILRGALSKGSAITDSEVKSLVCDVVAPGGKITGRAALHDVMGKMKGLFGLDLLPAWGHVKAPNVDLDDVKEAGRFTSTSSKYFVLRMPVVEEREDDFNRLERVIPAREHAKRGLLMACLCFIMMSPDVKQVREDEMFRYIATLQPGVDDEDGDDSEVARGAGTLRDWRGVIGELVAGKYLDRAPLVGDDESGDAPVAAAALPSATAGGSSKFVYRMGPRSRMIVGPALPLVLGLVMTGKEAAMRSDAGVIEAALGNESAGVVAVVHQIQAEKDAA